MGGGDPAMNGLRRAVTAFLAVLPMAIWGGSAVSSSCRSAEVFEKATPG